MSWRYWPSDLMVLVSCDRTVHGALESDAEGSEKDSVCDELQ